MRKGIILAVMLAIIATVAGCAFHGLLPAFLLPGNLLPGGGETAMPAATTSPVVTTEPTTATPATTEDPTPEPTPTTAPAPKPYDTVARYESAMPEGLTLALEYDRYATPLDYFVALKSGKVYEKASVESKKLLSFSAGTRYRVDKSVLGEDGKSHWYHVLWSDKTGSRSGYVKHSAGQARSFRLGMLLDRAKKLKDQTDMGQTVFITNYKDAHGKPPALPGGKEQDAWGYRRSQSAPAYSEASTKSAFRYAPDGLLGHKLEETGGMTKIFFPTFGEAYWVQNKYVSKEDDAIATLMQVVAVDRLHQNSAVLEYKENGWKLIGLSYVSTGKEGGYSLKTPLGDFMAQGRYKQFYYYADGTKVIDGHAPWAVRFSGGGYLHGVPSKSSYDEAGKRQDKPAAESLRSLGTTPQSHMCVRNYTSFAKFLYDRFVKGQGAVIVLE